MITRQLAQNLVAIGMADFLLRSANVSYHCCLNNKKDGCCQDGLVDVHYICLEALGHVPWAEEKE